MMTKWFRVAYFRYDNQEVKEVMMDFLPFCMSLATYADSTKRKEPYNEKEEVCGKEAPALFLETREKLFSVTD